MRSSYNGFVLVTERFITFTPLTDLKDLTSVSPFNEQVISFSRVLRFSNNTSNKVTPVTLTLGSRSRLEHELGSPTLSRTTSSKGSCSLRETPTPDGTNGRSHHLSNGCWLFSLSEPITPVIASAEEFESTLDRVTVSSTLAVGSSAFSIPGSVGVPTTPEPILLVLGNATLLLPTLATTLT